MKSLAIILAAILVFFSISTVLAQTKIVVVPLLGGTEGNAKVSDVLKGKIFSSKVGKGLTGIMERHPMGQTFVTPYWGLTFNLVPSGLFYMGSPEGEPGNETQFDERPQVETTISQSFYVQISEVQQWQWENIVGWAETIGFLAPGELNSDPSTYKNQFFPVTDVSFTDVQKWIDTLNRITNRQCDTNNLHAKCYRLPTEAEWEYAARAGTTNAYANHYNFDVHDTNTSNTYNSNLYAMGWYLWNNQNHGYSYGPKPVMRKQPNAWGLYDMHGNVREWCRDWYQGDYYSDPSRPGVDPEGPLTGFHRVLRGGDWGSIAESARSADRGFWSIEQRFPYYGFRLVLPIGQ